MPRSQRFVLILGIWAAALPMAHGSISNLRVANGTYCRQMPSLLEQSKKICREVGTRFCKRNIQSCQRFIGTSSWFEFFRSAPQCLATQGGLHETAGRLSEDLAKMGERISPIITPAEFEASMKQATSGLSIGVVETAQNIVFRARQLSSLLSANIDEDNLSDEQKVLWSRLSYRLEQLRNASAFSDLIKVVKETDISLNKGISRLQTLVDYCRRTDGARFTETEMLTLLRRTALESYLSKTAFTNHEETINQLTAEVTNRVALCSGAKHFPTTVASQLRFVFEKHGALVAETMPPLLKLRGLVRGITDLKEGDVGRDQIYASIDCTIKAFTHLQDKVQLLQQLELMGDSRSVLETTIRAELTERLKHGAEQLKEAMLEDLKPQMDTQQAWRFLDLTARITQCQQAAL